MERVVMSAGKKEKGENIWTWKTYPLNVARLWNLQWRWWDSDLRTPILALWLEYLAASDVVAALLIHLQLFGASVLPIYQHHLKVQCRFVLRGVSIYQFCSHIFGTFIKNPLTPSVLPGTPKSNCGRPLYCKKKSVQNLYSTSQRNCGSKVSDTVIICDTSKHPRCQLVCIICCS